MLDILFAFDPAVLTAFVVAGLLLNFTPGADFVFITASGISGGPKRGMVAGLGILVGVAVHVVAAAAGVSALLIAYPSAYHAIRIIGAVYLLWLAWASWNSTGVVGEGQAETSMMATAMRGFLTNVLNPKTALFIFAFIPQFTDPSIGPLWQQIMVLGAIFLFNGFLFAMCLGIAAGALSPVLRSRAVLFNKTIAVLFAGLALRLILD